MLSNGLLIVPIGMTSGCAPLLRPINLTKLAAVAAQSGSLMMLEPKCPSHGTLPRTTPFCLKHYRVHALDRTCTQRTLRFRESIPKAPRVIPTRWSNLSIMDGGKAVPTKQCARHVLGRRGAGTLPLLPRLMSLPTARARPWSFQWVRFSAPIGKLVWRLRERLLRARRTRRSGTSRLTLRMYMFISDFLVGEPRFGLGSRNEPRPA